MRYAIIENTEVINVIVADDKFIKDTKLTAIKCDDLICVGWSYIDGEFVAPKNQPAIKDEILA